MNKFCNGSKVSPKVMHPTQSRKLLLGETGADTETHNMKQRGKKAFEESEENNVTNDSD